MCCKPFPKNSDGKAEILEPHSHAPLQSYVKGIEWETVALIVLRYGVVPGEVRSKSSNARQLIALLLLFVSEDLGQIAPPRFHAGTGTEKS